MRDEEEECAKEVCSLTMTADNCFFTVFMFIKLDCTRLIPLPLHMRAHDNNY